MLKVLKEWNPDWHPDIFMTDYSEAESLAIVQVFPTSKIYLCDFHQEQRWQRWIKDKKHGLTASDGKLLLSFLRKMAFAESGKSSGQSIGYFYAQAEAQLRKSSVWEQNPKVRSWLESKWRPIPQVRENISTLYSFCTYCLSQTMSFHTSQNTKNPYFGINQIKVLVAMPLSLLVPSSYTPEQ